MSVIVVAEFPMTEQGAQELIDWSKSDDGYVVTRQHKGFENIRTFFGPKTRKQFTCKRNGTVKKIIKLIWTLERKMV